MVSSGLFHPSEVANIIDRIMRGGERSGRKAEKLESLTLTTLSHPQETMTGMTGLGEKRTHETLG